MVQNEKIAMNITSLSVDCEWMAQEVREYVEELEYILKLILPMAKGYAAAHPVGSNSEYIKEAENILKLNAD